MSNSSLSRLCALVACLLFMASCLSNSYQLAPGELERLSRLPPDERGRRVRVVQQTVMGDDAARLDEAPPAGEEYGAWVIVLNDREKRHHRHRESERASDDEDDHGGNDDDDGDGAAEALAVAVVLTAVASTVAVTAAAVEGSRFDGWAQVSTDYPVLVVDRDDRRRWVRLDELQPSDVARAERLVLHDFGGDVSRLERAPLSRRGFVYQLEFGAASLNDTQSVEGLGFAARAALGYDFSQELGLLLGGQFAAGDRTSASDGEQQIFDWRLFVQGEVWPLALGRLYAGPYLDAGYAEALRDDILATTSAGGPFAAGGLALQLEWTTRLAVTGRAGAALLPLYETGPNAVVGNHGVGMEFTLGISVY